MNEQQETNYQLKIKLTMLDYYRYYFSLFSLKPSAYIVNIICGAIMIIYTLSLFSHAYIAGATGGLNWKNGQGMLLDLVIIILFSLPFSRTYLIAYKDAKTHSFLDKYIDVSITHDKFIVVFGGKTLEYRWNRMYKIFEFRHGFALFIDDKELAFVLPKRYFKDKELLELIRTKLYKNDKTLKLKRSIVNERTEKNEKQVKNQKSSKNDKNINK